MMREFFVYAMVSRAVSAFKMRQGGFETCKTREKDPGIGTV